jgi:ACS family tartrate transporter-like MFS transporter
VGLFLAVLCLTRIGAQAMKGPFLGLTSEWLAEPAAAVGFAQVNTLGNVAAFMTATSIGMIRDATGSFQLVLLPLLAISALGCAGLPIIARRNSKHGASAHPAPIA